MKTRFLLAISCALTFIQLQQASAMDCTKATTNYEQIICADAKLLAADKTMNEAFVKAITSRSASEKAALRLDQKHWLEKFEQQMAVELKTGGKSISTYIFEDKVVSRSAALSEKPNGIAQDIAAKIIASIKLGSPLPALETIKSVGLLSMAITQMQGSAENQDWSKRIVNPSDAAIVKNFRYGSVTKFQSAKNGMVIFDINRSEGTAQCSYDLYLVATRENAETLRLVDSAFGEGLCGFSGEGSSGGVTPILYKGKPILMSYQEDGSNKIYEFLDVFEDSKTSSSLTIEAHNELGRDDKRSICNGQSGCFGLGQIKGLFKDFDAIDGAPVLADANGNKLEGLATVEAKKAKMAALPALNAVWKKTYCAEECLGSEPKSFPEPVVVDLNGKGQLAVVIAATEDEPFAQTLLFAKDPTGQWSNTNEIKVLDLSKDFTGYDFSEAVLNVNDYDHSFANEAQIQLRINDEGSLRILRFGRIELGRSYSECCALHELKLDGNQIEVIQELGLTPRAILDSVSVSAVGVPPESGN